MSKKVQAIDTISAVIEYVAAGPQQLTFAIRQHRAPFKEDFPRQHDH
jgi:hypothetical protein